MDEAAVLIGHRHGHKDESVPARKTAGSCAATADMQVSTSAIAARIRVSTHMRFPGVPIAFE